MAVVPVLEPFTTYREAALAAPVLIPTFPIALKEMALVSKPVTELAVPVPIMSIPNSPVAGLQNWFP